MSDLILPGDKRFGLKKNLAIRAGMFAKSGSGPAPSVCYVNCYGHEVEGSYEQKLFNLGVCSDKNAINIRTSDDIGGIAYETAEDCLPFYIEITQEPYKSNMINNYGSNITPLMYYGYDGYYFLGGDIYDDNLDFEIAHGTTWTYSDRLLLVDWNLYLSEDLWFNIKFEMNP